MDNKELVAYEGIVPSYRDSIFMPTTDLLKEGAEITLDAILNDGLLREIPVVSLLSATAKVIFNVRDRNLLKQTIAFILSFNNGTIKDDVLLKYRETLENDPKRAAKEIERITVLLDKTIDELRSRVLAKLYLSYVKGAISWEKFCELSTANSNMFIEDYGILHALFLNKNTDSLDVNSYHLDRLISLGLAQIIHRYGVVVKDVEDSKRREVQLTEFGKAFAQHSR